MFSGLFLLVPLLLVVPVALVVLVALAASARPARTLSAELVSARRHGVTTSIVAVVLQGLGLVLAPASLSWRLTVLGLDGPELAAVLPLVGSGLALTALLVGELTWPRPRGATRTAVIHERSVASLLRGSWARTAGVATGVLLLVILTAGWLGSNDTGDSISTVRYESDGAMTEHAAGPFPGWDYGVPQLVTLATVAVLLLLVLRAVTNRATVVTADLDTDRLLRRASAARAFRTATFGVLVTAAADLFFGGAAALNVHEGPAATLAVAAMLLGLACGIAAFVAVLVPAPRLPRVPAPGTGERVGA